QGGDSWDGGYYAMKQILETGRPPDGIFAANDPAALSALRALTEAGLKVPENTRLVGFDNIHLAEQARLTTLSVDKLDLGRTGACMLLDWINRKNMPENAVLSGSLIIRESA